MTSSLLQVITNTDKSMLLTHVFSLPLAFFSVFADHPLEYLTTAQVMGYYHHVGQTSLP